MKQALTLASFTYVAFALLLAAGYMVSAKTTIPRSTGPRTLMESVEPAVPNNQHMAGLVSDGIGPYDPNNLPDPEPQPEPRTTKSDYKVVVWTAIWCGPCQRYKRIEVPSLVKMGYTVTVKDYDTDGPPRSVTSVPTVMLYYKGKLISTSPYWRAKDLDKYVDALLSLKG